MSVTTSDAVALAQEAGALFKQGRGTQAAGVMAKALVLAPNNARFNVDMGHILVRIGDLQGGLAYARRAKEIGRLAIPGWTTVAYIATTAGDHRLAHQMYSRLLKVEEKTPALCSRLGSTHLFFGEVDKAVEYYDQAIALDPGYAMAYWLRSGARRATNDQNTLDQLQEALASHVKVADEHYLRFALFKELEDLGEYDQAFVELKLGCPLVRKTTPYDAGTDRALFDAIIKYCDTAFLQGSNESYSSDEPIYILGMPRTGTTLIDRVLEFYPQIASAGETYAVRSAIKHTLKAPLEAPFTPAMIQAWPTMDLARVGELSVQMTRPLTGHTAHYIDKFPPNFLYLGVMAKALPNCRIVHLTRNPMDTCFSNLKQLFAPGIFPHSYDQQNMTNYYLLYRQLMAHWCEQLGDRILHVDYDKFVGDPRSEAQRLVAHCGLVWDERCLQIEQRNTAVATASMAQVREPIYQSSRERWRCYERHLQPMREQLQACVTPA